MSKKSSQTNLGLEDWVQLMSNTKCLPAWTVLPWFSTSNVHVPLGFSPHVCVDMNSQSLKPSPEESPPLWGSKIATVPHGEISFIVRSPRRGKVSDITTCTCSKYLINWLPFEQAAVSTVSFNVPVPGMDLKKENISIIDIKLIINLHSVQ